MNFKHISVLLYESIQALNIKPEGIYVDGTLGGGGHAYEICKRLGKEGRLIGVDQDIEAILASKEKLKEYEQKVYFVNNNFKNIKEILKQLNIGGIDGGIMDLGVSSYQLDTEERGFSYQHDAPLDMRMDHRNPLNAYKVINTYSEEKLSKIIFDYGEEKWAKRIAKFIVDQRKIEAIKTTGQLVEIIKKAIPAKARRDGPHPAKRTFQAIRIEVNNELGILRSAIEDFVDVLKPQGRLAVITFHSLEDRIVKQTFNKLSSGCECPPQFPICVCGKKSLIKKLSRKPIVPSEKEIRDNPRARSAKLRVIEKVKS